MSGLVAICNWINRALSTAIEWIVSIPGLIVTFVGTLVGIVTFVVQYLTSVSSSSSSLVSGVISSISTVASSSVFQSDVFHLISWMAGLDVAYEYLSMLGGLFLGFVGLCFGTLFGGLILLFASVVSVNIIQKLVRLVSAGFVNV